MCTPGGCDLFYALSTFQAIAVCAHALSLPVGIQQNGMDHVQDIQLRSSTTMHKGFSKLASTDGETHCRSPKGDVPDLSQWESDSSPYSTQRGIGASSTQPST